MNFDLFWEAWNLVNEKYVDPSKIDKNKMIYGAISGMVKVARRSFFRLHESGRKPAIFRGLQGTFEGIGAEIGMKNDILTVIAPLEGTPADKAGLKAGDKIIEN